MIRVEELTSERNSRSCSTRERLGWSESLAWRNSSEEPPV